MEHYESDWWARQNYTDPLPRGLKIKRLVWLIAWTMLAKWMPYFVGRKWRVFLLSIFGVKHKCRVGVYPTSKVWAPWNVEMGSWVAIDDEVNLYSADKITIGTKVVISREAFICTARHDITKPNRPLVTAPITIDDGVWIGARAIILPGVTISEGRLSRQVR